MSIQWICQQQFMVMLVAQPPIKKVCLANSVCVIQSKQDHKCHIMKMITFHYEVIYSSKDRGGIFVVHTLQGQIKFLCHPSGLHYLDHIKKENEETSVLLCP